MNPEPGELQPYQTFATAAGVELGFTVYPDGSTVIRLEVREGAMSGDLMSAVLDAHTAQDFAERLTRSLQYAGNGPFGPGKDWKALTGQDWNVEHRPGRVVFPYHDSDRPLGRLE